MMVGAMDYRQYETYDFDHISAFNMSTGTKERSYQLHWHSYGELLLVGPGETNIFQINQNVYDLVEGDLILIWPMEVGIRKNKGQKTDYGTVPYRKPVCLTEQAF